MWSVQSVKFWERRAAALNAIMNEWTSGRDYSQRKANIIAGTELASGYRLVGDDGGSQTVFNDNDVDSQIGKPGQDWFLANKTADNGVAIDKIVDLALNEIYSDTDY